MGRGRRLTSEFVFSHMPRITNRYDGLVGYTNTPGHKRQHMLRTNATLLPSRKCRPIQTTVLFGLSLGQYKIGLYFAC